MSIGKPVAGVCVSTALFVCGAAGYPQATAELPPASGTLVLDQSTGGSPKAIAAGGSFVLTGDGFAGNAAVTLVVYSEPRELGRTVADATGRIDASVTLPADLTGQHTVTALGNAADGTPRSLQAAVDVLAAGETAPGPGNLAYTGLSVAGLLAGALGLIVAGFALVRTAVFGRRLTATS
jgi:hypothetical protein